MSGYNTDVSSDNNNNKSNNTITNITYYCYITVSNLFSCSGVLPWGKWTYSIHKGWPYCTYSSKKSNGKKRTEILIYKKREIFLTNFEKGTLIGAIIVVLTGLVAYGHITRGIFGPFGYLLLMSMYRVFLENNSTCVVYLEKQGRENTLKAKL